MSMPDMFGRCFIPTQFIEERLPQSENICRVVTQQKLLPQLQQQQKLNSHRPPLIQRMPPTINLAILEPFNLSAAFILILWRVVAALYRVQTPSAIHASPTGLINIKIVHFVIKSSISILLSQIGWQRVL
jgi:hypothetical protein